MFQVLEKLRKQCVDGTSPFQGGLLGTLVKCDFKHSDDMFRRLDGVCNNVAHHENRHWGASGTPFKRLAGVAYADGISSPRSAPGLPSPRQVSEAMHAAEISGTTTLDVNSGPLTVKGLTHMTMQFGQFLDHDITFTPQAGLVRRMLR